MHYLKNIKITVGEYISAFKSALFFFYKESESFLFIFLQNMTFPLPSDPLKSVFPYELPEINSIQGSSHTCDSCTNGCFETSAIKNIDSKMFQIIFSFST